MSKAIIGAALIAGAIILDAIAITTTGGIAAFWQPVFWTLLSSGISMESAAIAQALTSNRGMGITVRQAAGSRQIIYGQQRVGGVIVYESTTGAGGAGGNYVYNFVIAVASHVLDAFINIYFDGRQCFFRQDGSPGNIGCGTVATPPTANVTISGGSITSISASGGSGFANVPPTKYRVRITGDGTGAEAWATLSGGSGFFSSSAPFQGSAVGGTWTVTVTNGGSGYTWANADIQGAYTFGGTLAKDQQDPSQPGYDIGYGIGPGGPHYDFDGKGYVEARFGDQPSGDYMSSLSANDSSWPSSARGGGVAYLYVGIGYDPTQFPALPELRMTLNGKPIYDPRTGNTVYSSNWALQVADVITSSFQEFGLDDQNVNLDQWIAAANVCDEMVETSQGDEYNYEQHIHYDSSTCPGDALALMMPHAAGRISYIGGEHYIFPGYWQAPCMTLDQSYLIGDMEWKPYRSFKDLINCVNGTYTAPNYPYGLAEWSNLYDANGFWYGETENLWPLAWQPTSAPQYAVDTLHGYTSDVFLNEDGGIILPLELNLSRGVISVVQAQRVFKINLLRNRQQGMGTFPMMLPASQIQPLDVIEFNFPMLGWGSTTVQPTPVSNPPNVTAQHFSWAYPNAAPYSGNIGNVVSIGGGSSFTSTYEGFALPYPLPSDAVITGIYPAATISIEGTGDYSTGSPISMFPSTPNIALATFYGGSIGTTYADIAAAEFSFTIATNPFTDESETLTVDFLGLAVAFTSNANPVLYFANSQLLEVDQFTWVPEPVKDEAGNNGPIALTCIIDFHETAESVYEWSEGEELSVYDVPAAMTQIAYAPTAPGNLTVNSSPITNTDGIVLPALNVAWTGPNDNSVQYVNVEYAANVGNVANNSWTSTGFVSTAVNTRTILGVKAGTNYDIRVASVRNGGANSAYVLTTNVAVSANSSVFDAAQITSGTLATAILPNSGVIAGTYNTVNIANITVDATGRITSIGT